MVKKAKASKNKFLKVASPRLRQLDRKQKRLKAKKEAQKRPMPASSFKLSAKTWSILKSHWKPLLGIFVIYSVLNIIFASGLFSALSSTSTSIRQDLKQSHSLDNAFHGYGSLLGINGASGSASVAQSILLIFETLVIIWALRQILAGEKLSVKLAYYKSMTPLVPFLLVILVILIQLLPITLGSLALALILSTTVSSGSLVVVLSWIAFGLLAIWSIYMVSSSLFALYIVTLPEMQPRQALRSAKNLVRFRRWPLLRRLFFLPLSVIIVLGLITIVLILSLPFLVAPVFYLLLMFLVLYANTYTYSLYRELLE